MANIADLEKWGLKTADRRYGGIKPDKEPVNCECSPQSPEDKQAPGYNNDVASNWLRGMGKGEAEGKPSFDKRRSGG